MAEHYPYPTTVYEIEDVGGVLIETGVTTGVRCGCRDDLLYDFGDGHADIEHLDFTESA